MVYYLTLLPCALIGWSHMTNVQWRRPSTRESLHHLRGKLRREDGREEKKRRRYCSCPLRVPGVLDPRVPGLSSTPPRPTPGARCLGPLGARAHLAPSQPTPGARSHGPPRAQSTVCVQLWPSGLVSSHFALTYPLLALGYIYPIPSFILGLAKLETKSERA